MKTTDVIKSRTVVVGGLAPVLIMILEKFGITISAADAAAIMGALMVILRLITDSPVGGKTETKLKTDALHKMGD
jgi:hypothetical protein